ncbi:MAG: TolC family protein [Pseudomonadota bacterium]
MRLALAVFWLAATSLPAAEPLPILSLPPESVVRGAMEASPRLQGAHEAIASGLAIQQRLDAGTHEWEISAMTQRRTDAVGIRRDEQEYGLQRGMRWPWKASLDRQMGAQARDVGELAYADAWHEAGRSILDLWFGWLDAELGLQRLNEQLRVLVDQEQTVERRVNAGDAAQLELQLATAQTRHLQATRGDIARNSLQAREALLREFPDLALPLPGSIADPVALSDDDGTWFDRIVVDNHEIELAEAHAEAARLASVRSGRERLADPKLGLRYSGNLDGDREVIGLQISMALGGEGRSADSARARSAARAAASESQGVRLAVESAARSAISDARLRYQSWRDLASAAQQTQQTAAAVARGYALGEFDLATMLNSRRTALDLQQALESAQLAALKAHARVLLDAHQLWALPHDEEGDLAKEELTRN